MIAINVPSATRFYFLFLAQSRGSTSHSCNMFNPFDRARMATTIQVAPNRNPPVVPAPKQRRGGRKRKLADETIASPTRLAKEIGEAANTQAGKEAQKSPKQKPNAKNIPSQELTEGRKEQPSATTSLNDNRTREVGQARDCSQPSVTPLDDATREVLHLLQARERTAFCSTTKFPNPSCFCSVKAT